MGILKKHANDTLKCKAHSSKLKVEILISDIVKLKTKVNACGDTTNVVYKAVKGLRKHW